jgi:hypothetical protein
MQPDEKDAYLGRRQWKCESELFRRDGEGLLIAVYFMTWVNLCHDLFSRVDIEVRRHDEHDAYGLVK